MRPDYPKWLAQQQYAENMQQAQIYRVKKVEESYGNLDEHFANGTYQDIINSLAYSTRDERENRPNPTRIMIQGNVRQGLQSYKNAAVRYRRFLDDTSFHSALLVAHDPIDTSDVSTRNEITKQRFTLERDMQTALRKNISVLDPSLTIIDDGDERAVNSGFIDITCDDGITIVVIELKAGKADSNAIGQILGYMGDLLDEEGGKPVRGILVAHDFDIRTKAAARAVPSLSLKKYSIEFKFTKAD
jgi:hypothetical protein